MEQLKVLVAITETDSMQQAANQLFKSQSALSHSIKQLESNLGLTLFTRDKYRLTLSENGQMIYQKAKKALYQITELEQFSQHIIRGNEQQVTVVIEAAFDLKHLKRPLEAIQSDYPMTQITLRQEYLSGAITRLLNGEADIAITALPMEFVENRNELHSTIIGKGVMINVASKNMLSKYPNLTSIEELINENQIVVKDTGTGTNENDFNTQTAQRKWYVNSFGSKLNLIEQGMGWGMLPAHMIANMLDEGILKEIIVKDSDSKIHFPYFLVKSKKATLGPVSQKLWEKLNDN
ncbi:MAG: LysR family transcriptional regulator [Pseudomonadota bacterium]